MSGISLAVLPLSPFSPLPFILSLLIRAPNTFSRLRNTHVNCVPRTLLSSEMLGIYSPLGRRLHRKGWRRTDRGGQGRCWVCFAGLVVFQASVLRIPPSSASIATCTLHSIFQPSPPTFISLHPQTSYLNKQRPLITPPSISHEPSILPHQPPINPPSTPHQSPTNAPSLLILHSNISHPFYPPFAIFSNFLHVCYLQPLNL